MKRGDWLAQRPHEFEEDVEDGSMYLCGVPADSQGTRLPRVRRASSIVHGVEPPTTDTTPRSDALAASRTPFEVLQ